MSFFPLKTKEKTAIVITQTQLISHFDSLLINVMLKFVLKLWGKAVSSTATYILLSETGLQTRYYHITSKDCTQLMTSSKAATAAAQLSVNSVLKPLLFRQLTYLLLLVCIFHDAKGEYIHFGPYPSSSVVLKGTKFCVCM